MDVCVHDRVSAVAVVTNMHGRTSVVTDVCVCTVVWLFVVTGVCVCTVVCLCGHGRVCTVVCLRWRCSRR